MENNEKLILQFGKHKGKRIEDCPYNYQMWCYENLQDFLTKKYPEIAEYLKDNLDDDDDYGFERMEDYDDWGFQ